MSKQIRKLIIVLCFCMILPVLVSCVEKKEPPRDVNVDDEIIDTLEEGYSLDGETVTIFYNTGGEDSIMGYEDVLDLVYSKIYERNLKVQKRLDMTIDYVESNHGSNWENIANVLSSYIYHQDTSFQVVMTGNNVLIQKKLFPLFHDLNDSDYIDIDEPWYYKDAIMEISVDYYYYRFLYGDIHISDLGSSGAIFYNKDLFEQYIDSSNRDKIYDLVIDGSWTLERFNSMVKRSKIDKGENDSVHGYSIFRYGEPIHHFAVGCGVEYYRRGQNGVPQITINNDLSVDFTNALYKLLYDNEGAWLFYPNRVGEENAHSDDFMNNRVMFLLGNMNNCLSDSMREMESDYGIVPYPKWDEYQEEYITLIHNSSIATGIPVTIPEDDAMTKYSAFIEALSSESYRTVRVPYYETALKNTYSRDDLASQMLDILTGHHATVKSKLVKNFLYEYGSSLLGIGSIFSSLMSEKSKDFSSKYASIGDGAVTSLNELVKEYLRTSEG